MIEAGEFFLGRFREDEVQGAAWREVQLAFLAWTGRPQPKWPEGTTFTEPRKERQWSSLTTWAITPAGVRYELLLDRRDEEPDPRDEPPIVWSIHSEPGGALYALPRIAQMSITFDLEQHPVDDERRRDAYAGVPLGLARRYRFGLLSKPLREQTRVVSDGWRYAGDT